MKTLLKLSVIMVVFYLATFGTRAQLASEVKFYHYPVSLPNSDNTLAFGTARDNLLTGVKYGGTSFTSSGSRVGTNANNVTALEFRNVFDVGDMTVSTNAHLWRGQFSPSSPYDSQYGNRAYDAVILIGQDGKVCLDRMSYMTSCGSMPLLGNNSSLSGLTNSVSRIGINAGPDGILFTADDGIVTSGSGTNLYDAIAFIGGRLGALVNSQSVLDDVNAAVATGTWLRWEYFWNGPAGLRSSSITVPLYQSGQIPWQTQYNRLVPFIGPKGVLFSVVAQPGAPTIGLWGSRSVLEPFSLLNPAATEGTTAFWAFTGDRTNDFGFYRLMP